MKSNLLRGACAGVVALALVACSDKAKEPASTDATPAAEAGDQSIVVVAGAEPGSLDRHKNVDNGNRHLLSSVYEELYASDRDGKIVPLLAKALPKALDATTYEIALRNDVKFSDGTPFNADSVVFSVKHVLDPKTATALAGMKTITGAEKVDDFTVRIKTTAAAPLLANLLLDLSMYPPVDKDFKLAEHVVGTGPYKLVSYTPGRDAVVAYNDKYRGSKPQVTKVTIKFVPDGGTRIRAIVSGEADVAAEISPTQASEVRNVVVTSRPAWSAFVRINTVTGLTKDVRVRHAMNYAVDRKAIVEKIFGNKYAVVSSCTPLPRGTGGTSDKITLPYTYDPEKAKKLIKEAGAEGQTIQMFAPSGQYPEDRAVSELVVQYLTNIGLKINLEFLPTFPVFLAKLVTPQEKAPPLMFTQLVDTRLHVDRGLTNYYASSGPPSAYNNPKMDELIAKASATIDPAAAQPIYDEALKLACDEAPFIYLYDNFSLFALSDRMAWSPGANAFGGSLRYAEMKVVKPKPRL